MLSPDIPIIIHVILMLTRLYLLPYGIFHPRTFNLCAIMIANDMQHSFNHWPMFEFINLVACTAFDTLRGLSCEYHISRVHRPIFDLVMRPRTLTQSTYLEHIASAAYANWNSSPILVAELGITLFSCKSPGPQGLGTQTSFRRC